MSGRWRTGSRFRRVAAISLAALSVVVATALSAISCAQSVTDERGGPGLRIVPDSVDLFLGDNVQLSVLGSTQSAVWSSNNAQVATVVGSTGYVTAVGPGTAGITAVAGSASATARVRVDLRPAIGFSSPGVDFTVVRGQADPPPQTVHIGNTGGATLSALSITGIQYGEGQPSGWLQATLTSANLPSDLVLTARSAGLDAGTYTASVRVQAGAASNSPQNIGVRLTITPAATIELSTTDVNFSAVVNGPDPSPQQVTVSNGTTATTLDGLDRSITYGAGQPAGWLTATLSGAQAPSILRLQAAVAGLPAGTYAATVTLHTNQAGVAARSLTVGLTVSSVRVASTAIAPKSVTLDLGGTFQFTATARDGAGNTLSGRQTTWTARDPAIARVDSGGLVRAVAAGVTFIVADVEGVRDSAEVTVSAPALTVAPAQVQLSAQMGSNPQPVTATIASAGNSVIQGLRVAAIAYGGAAQGWLLPTLNAATTPALLHLSANVAQLAAGTYTASLTIASDQPGVTPATLSVSLVLTSQSSPPHIHVTSAALVFSGAAGGTDPQPQSIGISNSGGGALTGLSVDYAGSKPAWLDASLSSSNAPANLTVQTHVTGLAAGSYTAGVLISSALADNSPVQVAVTLNVTAAATTTLSVTGGGAGNGSVGSAPGGISCTITAGAAGASGCSAAFPTGTSVTLTATPATGFDFVGWNGGCAGPAAACVVTMNSNQSVSATFESSSATSFPVTIGANSSDGAGEVYSTSGSGFIDCFFRDGGGAGTGNCTGDFPRGDTVVLTVYRVPGFVGSPDDEFLGWGGDCAGAGAASDCRLVMDRSHNVTARFRAVYGIHVKRPTTQLAGLTSEAGRIVSDPAGIDCTFVEDFLHLQTSGTCDLAVYSHTPVRLTMIGADTTAYVGLFRGPGCQTVANPCSFVSTDVDFYPIFALTDITLWPGVTVGTGHVTSTPAGVDCIVPGLCTSPPFKRGTSVTLMAQPDASSLFISWTGDCTGTALTCTMVMDAPKTVSANFGPLTPLIHLSSPSLTFEARPGTVTAAQIVNITNAGIDTVRGLTVTVPSWITASLNSTKTPATLTLTANAAGLPNGTQNGTVSVSSSNASNSPQPILVRFDIGYSFSQDILPALGATTFSGYPGVAVVACASCHRSPPVNGAHSDFTSYAGVLTQVSPGDPNSSPLVQRMVLPAGSAGAMSPSGQRHPQGIIDMIRDWILQGARAN